MQDELAPISGGFNDPRLHNLPQPLACLAPFATQRLPSYIMRRNGHTALSTTVASYTHRPSRFSQQPCAVLAQQPYHRIPGFHLEKARSETTSQSECTLGHWTAIDTLHMPKPSNLKSADDVEDFINQSCSSNNR